MAAEQKRCFTATESLNFFEELKNSDYIKAFVISTSNKIKEVKNNQMLKLNGTSKAIAKYQNSPKKGFEFPKINFENQIESGRRMNANSFIQNALVNDNFFFFKS